MSPEGGPSTLLPAPWAYDGSYAPDGRRLVVDRVSRWDWEWRSYRGGQNTPLTILDLGSLDEVRLPNPDRTTDRWPVWVDGKIWFVSDRDWAMNVWSYDVATQELTQVTRFADAEVKWLDGGAAGLVLEQDGWIHTLDPATGRTQRLDITVQGDFPWAETRWEDVSRAVSAASLSPTGKRVLMEARGEIFTVPVEAGSTRNLTRSSGAADRSPLWSPDGKEVAWFSDAGDGYQLLVAPQDGLGEARRISIGESKFAWEATWSPDGKRIAFVDDDARIRVVDVAGGSVRTADAAATVLDRGSLGLAWSPDSRWLAYAKSYPNNLRRIVVWSADSGDVTPLTDPMADARSPSFDRDGKHLWFLASTDVALASGWANTSSINANPTFGVYVMVLPGDGTTPFPPKSDEENAPPPPKADTGAVRVRIDFAGVERRILALPMPVRNYRMTVAGPKGTVFVGEAVTGQDGPPGMTVHKFSLAERKADVFVRGAAAVSISKDGEKMLFRSGQQWRVVGTARPPDANGGNVTVALRMQLDRAEEWRQIFDEAWRYEKDFFYDPGMHGNDWNAVTSPWWSTCGTAPT